MKYSLFQQSTRKATCLTVALAYYLSFLYASPAIAAKPARLDLSTPHPVENYQLGAGGQIWVHRLAENQIVEALLSRRCQLKVHAIKGLGLPKELYKNVNRGKANLVVTGGFFGYDTKGRYMPIGLVRSEGKRLNSIIPWSTGGVLVGSPGKMAILPVRHIEEAAKWEEAIQSKPILIVKNQIDVKKNLRDGNFNRVSIGLTTDDRIYVVGIFHNFGEAVTLVEHAEVMIHLANQRNLAIASALAMDGGPGAHIYVPAKDAIYGDTATTYIPNAVSFGECN